MKKSTITFPKISNTPVIMVGPDTGVAPFRSYIQDRTSQNIGDKFWVKNGTITFPKISNTPVIMVGPGTGVATFRSY